MEKYDDLELTILCCFLQKPDLLEKTELENKHFKKHYKIFNFFKAVYKRFGTLDISIMYSISKNKYRIIEYIAWVLEYHGFVSQFKKYERQLIELYEENKKDRWIIDNIYELANDLLVKNISTEDFKAKVDEIYKNANEIFKNDN